jgi:hypothetical protein
MRINREADCAMAPRNVAQSREQAEALAVHGLTFLASDMERLEPFLSLSGLDLGNLRAAAAGPDFLVAVLEHLLGNENLLLAFATNAGLDPAEVARARDTLSPPARMSDP